MIGGIYGDMFDLDHDGHMDGFERMLDLDFFHMTMAEEEEQKSQALRDDLEFDWDDDDDDDEYYTEDELLGLDDDRDWW